MRYFASSGDRCRGLREGSPELHLPLADAGYTLQSARQHFHVVVGAADHQAWPTGLKETSQLMIRELEALCAELLRLLPGGDRMEAAWRRASKATGDASVWDAFSYFPTESVVEPGAVDVAMAAHTDPGLFTAKPLSFVEGLEVWDFASDKWISVEGEGRGAGEIVVFSADTLERWTKGAIPSCRHRVAKPRGSEPRLSLVYEMRILREGVDLEQMP
ncbi:Cercam [Symbiodinium natans]|uniref:Cercam protein n=1 Tax=Symbiodinium natans TaxID=878477 RepID=A0A812N0M8_9DINO|nr:Cercam [Symbiodinium natans]